MTIFSDWNESECSESDFSSEAEEDEEDFMKKDATDDDAMEQRNDGNLMANYKKSIYILIDSKETLNLTITPQFLKVTNELFTIYSNKTLSIIHGGNSAVINLTNDIGPKTVAELYEKKSCHEGNSNEEEILLCSKTYENQDSLPNSPVRNVYYEYNSNDINDDRDR